jgi:flagellar biosynthetic protein FlhB
MRIFKKEGGFQPEIPIAVSVPDALDPHSLLAAPSVEDANIEVIENTGVFI